jgi:mannosyltransferase OCH1-like enzyme
MISKIIHQIWVGGKKMPEVWMKTWAEKNPNFKYKLWRESDLDDLLSDSKNKRIYQKYCRLGIYHGAADVARAEILNREGGIYIDADSIALEPLEGAPFLAPEITFFAAYDHAVPQYPGRITNGVIGSVAHHPILTDYIERMHLERMSVEPWKTIGGKLLTECIKRHGPDKTVIILPAWMFWPENFTGTKITPEGKVYAQQMWGTSLGLY